MCDDFQVGRRKLSSLAVRSSGGRDCRVGGVRSAGEIVLRDLSFCEKSLLRHNPVWEQSISSCGLKAPATLNGTIAMMPSSAPALLRQRAICACPPSVPCVDGARPVENNEGVGPTPSAFPQLCQQSVPGLQHVVSRAKGVPFCSDSKMVHQHMCCFCLLCLCFLVIPVYRRFVLLQEFLESFLNDPGVLLHFSFCGFVLRVIVIFMILFKSV